MTSRLFYCVVAILSLACSFAGEASAHAALKAAIPAANAMAMPPPTELQLEFTQDLVSGSSKITVTGPDQKAVETGAYSQPSGNILIVPLSAPVPDGIYTVNWHVLCVDGEETEGSYTFESMN